MAARLRRAEPAFADRSLPGPAKAGFVPAVRVPTGEPPATVNAVGVGQSGRPIGLRAVRTPGPAPVRAGTVPEPSAVLPVPARPVVGRPGPHDRTGHPASRSLSWSGVASVLLHLGVALPFLVMLPNRDVPPAGGEAETFEVEIVPAGEADADRLARAGAAPAPDRVAAVPPASGAAAASPPEDPSPPDDASAPAVPSPIEPAGASAEVTPPAEAVAEPPPPENAASETPAPSALRETPAPAVLPETVAADTVLHAPTEAIPDPDSRPEAASDGPAGAPAQSPAPPAASPSEVEEPAPFVAADPPPSASERQDAAVAPEGERIVDARADSAVAPQPARRAEPVASAPEAPSRSPASTWAVVAEPATAPPPRVVAAPRESASRPAGDRATARSRPPTATPEARSAPPRSTAVPPSRSGADRSDGGSSAATTRAGAAAARGDGQAGAEVLASYRHRVLAHLARHKQYPESARDRGIEGRVAVTFTVSASGQVVAAALAGSSGRPELDRITLATVQRASPFPPIPPGGPTTMTFRTALRYDLR